jgi:hypothetical protein
MDKEAASLLSILVASTVAFLFGGGRIRDRVWSQIGFCPWGVTHQTLVIAMRVFIVEQRPEV